MKLKTDADRALLQHLQERIAEDMPYFDGHLIGPSAPDWSEVSIQRFVQSGLLIPDTHGSYKICVDAVEGLASAGDGKRKSNPKVNAKGSQALKLVGYLTKHHQYGNGIVGNYHPAESSDIARELKVSRSTVSDFLSREFESSGSPRDGYVAACKSQAKLLLWLLTKHGDSLPTRTDSLEDYDSADIREKW